MEEYYRNELCHHGIKGMKWGVRRYQNFDGSYTREGLKRYNKSMAEYERAKEAHNLSKTIYKESKKGNTVRLNGTEVVGTKDLVRNSKSYLKDKKRQLNKDYDQLKRDKAGDKGKELYAKGKRITSNARHLKIAATIATGAGIAAKYLYDSGNINAAKYTAMAAIGLEAVNGVFAVKNEIEAHYLRSYYGHSRK